MTDTTEGTQPAPDGANAGGTQPEADASNAGTGKTFTEDDVARARKDGQKRAARDAAKAVAARERELLDSLDADSWEDLHERLDGKRKADSDLEKQVSDAKRKAREAGKRAADYDELQQKYTRLLAERNQHAMRNAIFSAAKGANAHEDLVFDHLIANNRVAVDEDGQVVVLGADGEPAGLSLEKLVTQIVADKPALQRPSGAPGSGSRPHTTGARPGADSTATASDKLRGGIAAIVDQNYGHLARR